MDELAGVGVTARGVRKTYGAPGAPVVAVAGCDLDVYAGSAVALTGPSGSGKSTLLHLLGGMDRPDAGSIVVGGVDIARAKGRDLVAHRRRVGFVFQRFHLLPALTALDNVLAPVLPYRVPFNKRERALELLAAVGLDGRERFLPHKLSGGQQQRVAIARALIGRPQLLLADEPTGNLDSATGESVIELLLGLREQHATTLVIATHDMTLAARCDVVVRLRDGVRMETSDIPVPVEDEVLRRISRLA